MSDRLVVHVEAADSSMVLEIVESLLAALLLLFVNVIKFKPFEAEAGL